MQIETYEINEVTTDHPEPALVEAEAIALIHDLGLEGQKELIQSVTDAEGVEAPARIPYEKMTQSVREVLRTCFPKKSKVDAYSGGPIPLRVLQVIAHARPLFDDLVIWSPDHDIPDPVLVGLLGPNEYNCTHFLLARWGDALEPMEVLHERARDILLRSWDRKAKTKAAEIKSFQSMLAEKVDEKLSGGNVYPPF